MSKPDSESARMIAGLEHALDEALKINAELLASRDTLRAALAKWAATYPDLGDAHDGHQRGRLYTSSCAGCLAEAELIDLANDIADSHPEYGVEHLACAGAPTEPVRGQVGLELPARLLAATYPSVANLHP